MAQSIRDIKRRIKSITSTQKITKAMELVSSAKLQKATLRLEKARPYYYTIINNTQQLVHDLEGIKHPFLEKRKTKRSLCVVISDDRGMSGGYNNSIMRVTEELIKESGNKVDLILIGNKAVDYFSSRNYNILGRYGGITENPTFSDAKIISDAIMELYKSKKVDRVKIAYTQFVNNFTQETRTIQVFPVERFVHLEQENNKVMEFEPSVEEFLDHLIPKYVDSCVYGTLIEASCSQQAARRIAMEVATENADEMISDLKNKHNRARQSAITTELTEIITGVQAIK